MLIEQNGDVLTVRRLKDPAEEKRKLKALVADLRAIGAPPDVQARDPFEFPERPASSVAFPSTALQRRLHPRELASRFLIPYIRVYPKGFGMNAVSSKTFKSGNSVALRLPRALGIAAGVEMRIEKDGDALVVRPARNPAAEKAKLRRLIDALEPCRRPARLPDATRSSLPSGLD